MSGKRPIDAVDRQLLRLLAENGRASFQALADEVGLSRPAVMERVRRLEGTGIITGYSAQLDRAKAGVPVTAFVAVRYGGSGYVGDEPRMRSLLKHPGVLEAHHVAGDDCYILKVAARDLEGIQDILRTLAGSPKQLNTKTTIVLSTLFEKASLMLPPEND